MRWLLAVGLVVAIAGCASLSRLSERLCYFEVIHASFCEEDPEPKGEE